MTHSNFKIEPFSDKDREKIITLWEKSVLATHHFLKQNDFEEIKKLVQSINFNDFEVYCLKAENVVAGFIGLAERKIEMLFLSPDYIGRGFGKKLTDFAITELHADKVDVNEQNESAVRFYQNFGFTVYERTEEDDQGKPYPLLRMKLEN